MSKVIAPVDRMAGPSSMRGGGGRGGAPGSHGTGSVNGGTPAAGNLPPWSQDQPTPEELTLYTTLSAYADALDALPLDLTRSFSDLRELDAVLGPHLNSLTSRLNQLTAIIEDPSFTPGERLSALKEVAEEARAYKMGGEDKIRVALNTAETIISHTTYIDTLLANLSSVPSLATILSPARRSHLAGHLTDGTALAPGSGPGGNNPANADSIVDSNSPTKKKRQGQTGAGQSNANVTPSSAAEKRANEAAAQQSTANAVAKKRKQQAAAAKARAAKEAAEDTDGDLPAPPTKRPAVKRSNKTNGASANDRDDDGKDSEGAIVTSNSRSRGGRARNANVAIRGSGSDNEDDGSDTGSAAPRSARVARAPRPAQPVDNETANAAATAMGDDADERRYCFCNNVSYGDMIGCDGDDCEREWFHLGCVGLLKPPQGTWYCDDCSQKRSIQSRNKKTKTKLAKTSGAHGGGVVETKTRTASGKR